MKAEDIQVGKTYRGDEVISGVSEPAIVHEIRDGWVRYKFPDLQDTFRCSLSAFARWAQSEVSPERKVKP